MTMMRSASRFWSISLGGIATAAFFALVVLPRCALPLVDGDVWWHLHAGETILDTGAVPHTDTWTLVGSGMRWISQDWLSNVLMAAVNRGGGEWGATLLSLGFAGLVVGAFALLWKAAGALAPRSGWLARIGWLAAGLVVSAPVLGVRVQTVDLVMSAVVLWILSRYVVERRMRWVLALPLVALVWVNLHAGFPLLFAFGGAVVVGEGLDRILRRPLDREPLSWTQIGWLATGLAIAALALVLNPNGAAIYGYPFATAGIQAHHDFIFEWSRPDLSSLPGQLLLGFVVAGVLPTIIVGRRAMRAADALWLLGAVALGLSAIRFVLVIGPVGALMAIVYLAPRIGATRVGRAFAPALKRMSAAPRGRGQLIANVALTALVVIAGFGVALARTDASVQAAAIAEAMPVRATAWLRDHAPAARLFNVYAWGGWLGRELPRARVFIDGRSDIYGNAPIQEFAAVINIEIDPRQLLDRYDVDHVVYWPDSALAEWLDRQADWRRVYADGQAAIWERAPR